MISCSRAGLIIERFSSRGLCDKKAGVLIKTKRLIHCVKRFFIVAGLFKSIEACLPLIVLITRLKAMYNLDIHPINVALDDVWPSTVRRVAEAA